MKTDVHVEEVSVFWSEHVIEVVLRVHIEQLFHVHVEVRNGTQVVRVECGDHSTTTERQCARDVLKEGGLKAIDGGID